jgi:hypothetical protein
LKKIALLIIGVDGEFFIPEGIQGFLDDNGFNAVGLALDTNLNIRVAGSSQITGLDSSGLNDFDDKFSSDGHFLSFFLCLVARHFVLGIEVG